jgi:glucosamine-6-phosphate deaminase
MRVVVLENAEAVAEFAALQFIQQLANKPDSVLGLATGSTPLGTYGKLISAHRDGRISFKRVKTFNLDEYLGLSPDHSQSYHRFMRESLFDHIDIQSSGTRVPRGDVSDVDKETHEYERAIQAAGGIDLQLLGIGTDGHIAFNEPGSSLASRTRVKTLTRRTREDNARFFGSFDEVPKMALTMGIGTILESRSILLLACGEGKADAIQKTVEGPVTSLVPGSALQLHPQVTIAVDIKAASKLSQLEYYADCERNRTELGKV